jgi:hypothetical protein
MAIFAALFAAARSWIAGWALVARVALWRRPMLGGRE